MALWHLIEIENSMNKIGWIIIERIEPNRKENYIGGWIIKRNSEKIVSFDGIFDGFGNTIQNPSIEKAIGFCIKDTKISLYFYRKGKQWDLKLNKFVKDLNELE